MSNKPIVIGRPLNQNPEFLAQRAQFMARSAPVASASRSASPSRTASVPSPRRQSAPAADPAPVAVAAKKAGKGKGKSPSQKAMADAAKMAVNSEEYYDSEGHLVRQCFDLEAVPEKKPRALNHYSVSTTTFTVDRHILFGLALKGTSGTEFTNAVYAYATDKFGSLTRGKNIHYKAYDYGVIYKNEDGIRFMNFAKVLDNALTNSKSIPYDVKQKWADFKENHTLPSAWELQERIRTLDAELGPNGEKSTNKSTELLKKLLEKNIQHSRSIIAAIWPYIGAGKALPATNSVVNWTDIDRVKEIIKNAKEVTLVPFTSIKLTPNIVDQLTENDRKVGTAASPAKPRQKPVVEEPKPNKAVAKIFADRLAKAGGVPPPRSRSSSPVRSAPLDAFTPALAASPSGKRSKRSSPQ